MNIIGVLNMPKQPLKSAADEWWEGLPKDCCGAKIDASNTVLESTNMWATLRYKACFNEGLRWDKGFEEWAATLAKPLTTLRGLREINGFCYTENNLRDCWQSIHQFKSKQAEGR